MGYAKSSTCFKLEKDLGDGFTSIIEFHTVVNGNTYVVEKEYLNGVYRNCTKEMYKNNKEGGNKFYKRCLMEGYKFIGKYEMDVCGNFTKLEDK